VADYEHSETTLFSLPVTIARFTAIAGALFLMAAVGRAADMPVLVLNDTNEAPYTTADGTGFLDAVAGEAFRRAGVKLKLVKLPAERALINANSGLEDGDLTRIAGLEAQYPNLVRVPEKLIDWDFSAFGKNPALPARWEVIRQRPVAHIRGWKIYERELAGAKQILTAEDPAQLFRLLELDRVEVVLYARWMGMSLINRQGMKGIYVLDPSLAKRGMFIYLNKRHAALVPRIAEALRAIKAEGLYDRLYREKVFPLARPSPK
jgi:polar amino acid transport system substrate-binding protein